MSQGYIATVPWSPARPETLVVCCSDGRWRAQVEEFVRAEISERSDLLAVPGGAAAFCWLSSSFEEARVAENSFRFLAAHHQLRTVCLIAHAECAYYKAKAGASGEANLRQCQHEDLKRAREIIGQWYPALVVRKVYAFLDQYRVVFTTVSDD